MTLHGTIDLPIYFGERKHLNICLCGPKWLGRYSEISTEFHIKLDGQRQIVFTVTQKKRKSGYIYFQTVYSHRGALDVSSLTHMKEALCS